MNYEFGGQSYNNWQYKDNIYTTNNKPIYVWNRGNDDSWTEPKQYNYIYKYQTYDYGRDVLLMKIGLFIINNKLVYNIGNCIIVNKKYYCITEINYDEIMNWTVIKTSHPISHVTTGSTSSTTYDYWNTTSASTNEFYE